MKKSNKSSKSIEGIIEEMDREKQKSKRCKGGGSATP
jgi:hypothetical protein